MVSEELFFQNLLLNTKEAFSNSAICVKQKHLNQEWNYSVCGTPLQVGKGIIMGINWGADGNHPAQTMMPDGRDILDYKFISRSRLLLESYIKIDFVSLNFNYTNLCFFRTPRESLLEDKDYELSLPIFRQLVEYINPPWIFSLAIRNYQTLSRLKQLHDTKEFKDSSQKVTGIKAQLWEYPFYAVPHPNARVSSKSRQEIWKQVGNQLLV